MEATPRIPMPIREIEGFCRTWGVIEFAVFGSVLRDDFTPTSDIDVLVTFERGAGVSLWDWGPMLEELRLMFGRRVDLVEKAAIRNPIRRRHILEGHQILYAA